MCSFILSTLLLANFFNANKLLQPRGPDGTSAGQCTRHFFCLHNLLWLTGKRTEQPIKAGAYSDRYPNRIALFNGEIYNFRHILPTAESEGEALMFAYEKHGNSFLRLLDGEFAVAILDESQDSAILGRDTFGTKPLWLSLECGLHVSSYASALAVLLNSTEPPVKPDSVDTFVLFAKRGKVVQVPPNTGVSLKRNLGQRMGMDTCQSQEHWEISDTFPIFEFDLRQFKTDFDDWNDAFFSSAHKRAGSSPRPVVVPLSAGLDSGAIHAALKTLKLPYQLISIVGNENWRVMRSRLDAIEHPIAIRLSAKDFLKEKNFLATEVEPFEYDSNTWGGGQLSQDSGAIGLSFIARRAKELSFSVVMSGGGADEIFSDYGFNNTKLHPHSSFGGLFPKDMHSVFPWSSFFLGTQRDYLAKEEHVGGAHGLETRYPFLDVKVVQEFLWLSTELKNQLYKSVVTQFLQHLDYPYETGVVKKGFGAGSGLKASGDSEDIFPENEVPATSGLQSVLSSLAMSYRYRNVSQLLLVRGRRVLGKVELDGFPVEARQSFLLVFHLVDAWEKQIPAYAEFSSFSEFNISQWPLYTLLRFYQQPPDWVLALAVEEEKLLSADLADLLYGSTEILGEEAL